MLALNLLVTEAEVTSETLSTTEALANDTIWISIIKAVLVLVFLLTSVLFAVWFERRVIGRLQERPGPTATARSACSSRSWTR